MIHPPPYIKVSLYIQRVHRGKENKSDIYLPVLIVGTVSSSERVIERREIVRFKEIVLMMNTFAVVGSEPPLIFPPGHPLLPG